MVVHNQALSSQQHTRAQVKVLDYLPQKIGKLEFLASTPVSLFRQIPQVPRQRNTNQRWGK